MADQETSTGGAFTLKGEITHKRSAKEQTQIDASAIAYFKASVAEQVSYAVGPDLATATFGTGFSETPLSASDIIKIGAIFDTHPDVRKAVAKEVVETIDTPNGMSADVKKQLTELIGEEVLKDARIDKSAGKFFTNNSKLDDALKDAGLGGEAGQYAMADASLTDAPNAVTSRDIKQSSSNIIT
jgi:hypothetical protein